MTATKREDVKMEDATATKDFQEAIAPILLVPMSVVEKVFAYLLEYVNANLDSPETTAAPKLV